jgi:hypothetical protein
MIVLLWCVLSSVKQCGALWFCESEFCHSSCCFYLCSVVGMRDLFLLKEGMGREEHSCNLLSFRTCRLVLYFVPEGLKISWAPILSRICYRNKLTAAYLNFSLYNLYSVTEASEIKSCKFSVSQHEHDVLSSGEVIMEDCELQPQRRHDLIEEISPCWGAPWMCLLQGQGPEYSCNGWPCTNQQNYLQMYLSPALLDRQTPEYS